MSQEGKKNKSFFSKISKALSTRNNSETRSLKEEPRTVLIENQAEVPRSSLIAKSENDLSKEGERISKGIQSRLAISQDDFKVILCFFDNDLGKNNNI
jgi:hypothetical protein